MTSSWRLPTTASIIVLLVILLFSNSYAEFKKTKIAVLDFELHGQEFQTADMGSIVSEWFTTTLVNDGRFEVVERAMLQKILAEQQLGTTGLIDDSSASKIGKVLGVKIIITGSVLNFENKLEVNSRIINVENGSIVAAENISSTSSGDLQRVITELTGRIVKKFPLTGYIVMRKDTSVLIDLGLQAGLHQGMEFKVFKEGSIIKHPKTGEVLDVEQIVTGRVKISEVQPHMAKADIINEENDGICYGQLITSIAQSPQPAIVTSLGEDWSLTLKEADGPLKATVHLEVDAVPADAQIRILNISPRYYRGIELTPGPYHIEVSKPSFGTERKWVQLEPGFKAICSVSLSPDSRNGVVEREDRNVVVESAERRDISPQCKMLRSTNYKEKITAAKQITRGRWDDISIFDEVEKQLLAGYKAEGRGREHIDAMAWLVKALAASSNPKYKTTLTTVRDNSGSFKLTMYATKSLLTL